MSDVPKTVRRSDETNRMPCAVCNHTEQEFIDLHARLAEVEGNLSVANLQVVASTKRYEQAEAKLTAIRALLMLAYDELEPNMDKKTGVLMQRIADAVSPVGQITGKDIAWAVGVLENDARRVVEGE